jgi:hypothetical protein
VRKVNLAFEFYGWWFLGYIHFFFIGDGDLSQFFLVGGGGEKCMSLHI